MNLQSRSGRFIVASVILAGLLLFLVFRNVNFDEVLGVLKEGRPGLLLLACLTLGVSYFVRGLRWRVLLSAEKRVSPIMVFWATMVGYLGNNLLPARAGELIRTATLGSKAGISKGFVLGTVLVERGIDVVALVLISTVALVSLDGAPDWLPNAVLVAAALTVAAIVGLLLVTRIEGFLMALLDRLPLPAGLRDLAVRLLPQFLLGMRAFQHPVRAVLLVGLTLAVWLLDSLMVVELAQAFNLSITMPQALLLLAALALASTVPLTPGYVGVYQFVAVTVLTPFAFTDSSALAYIIAFQALGYAVVIPLGFVAIWQLAVWGQTYSYAGWLRWVLRLRRISTSFR